MHFAIIFSDDIIKIDRKEKRKQRQQKAPPAARQGQLATRGKKKGARGGGNQQNRPRRKPQKIVGSKVKQFRGQVGGNKFVGAASTPQGNKRRPSAAQQKAALLKRKAKQAQRVSLKEV